jgi:hypothetical protein
VVQHPLRLGVAGVVHLEAAVEQHPVDDVGADPASDAVGGLRTVTSSPAVRRARAQASPASPAPTTTTSLTRAA